MELHDLKKTWNDVDTHTDTEERLTVDMINQMRQKKSASKVNKVVYSELVGIILCLLSVGFIVGNFNWLNTTYLTITGALTVTVLLAICTLSLMSILRIQQKKELHKPYAETLKSFAIAKLEFHKLQKLNVTLCYLLLVGVVVLLSKIVNGIDISDSKYYWIFSFTLGYLFLAAYSRWVSRFYKNSIQEAEDLLHELK